MNHDRHQEEIGKVLSINGTRAELEITPGAGCEHCGAKNLCNWTGKAGRRIVAHNPVGAQPGEMVIISRSSRAVIHSALLVFGLPVLGLISGIVLGEILLGETWAVVFAGFGLGLAIMIIRLIDRVRGSKGTNLPVIVRIFTPEGLKGAVNHKKNITPAGEPADDDVNG
ncbi:MAG: SoxR reducing system RseC family protein [bacterium]